MIKEKIKQFYKKRSLSIKGLIGVLAIMTCIFGVESCKTYAYTYDSTTEVYTSDNLLNQNQPTLHWDDYYLYQFENVENDIFALTWNSEVIIGDVFLLAFNGKDYFGSWFSSQGYCTFDVSRYTDSHSFSLRFKCNNISNANIMLVKGLITQKYEPYGQTLYTSSKVEDSYNEGYQNGFNPKYFIPSMQSWNYEIRDNNTMQTIRSGYNLPYNDLLDVNSDIYILYDKGNVKVCCNESFLDYDIYSSFCEVYVWFTFTAVETNQYKYIYNGFQNYGWEIRVTLDDNTIYSMNKADSMQNTINLKSNQKINEMYFQWSTDNDRLSTSFMCNQDIAEGFNEGYKLGVYDTEKQFDIEREKGYNEGYSVGISEGYQNGYNEGTNQDFAQSGFKTLINEIISYPINMIKNCLSFEFMGINIFALITFIVSCGIVIFVIRKFK